MRTRLKSLIFVRLGSNLTWHESPNMTVLSNVRLLSSRILPGPVPNETRNQIQDMDYTTLDSDDISENWICPEPIRMILFLWGDCGAKKPSKYYIYSYHLLRKGFHKDNFNL